MGEVRVKVKLTNVIDAGLVRRGMLTPDQVRTCVVEGIADTGAVSSTLPLHIAQQLGLAMVEKARAEYANGFVEEVDVTEPVNFEINNRRASEEAMVLGAEMLIGQTLLERMDWLVDCRNQRLVGNPDHPDQAVLKIRRVKYAKPADVNHAIIE